MRVPDDDDLLLYVVLFIVFGPLIILYFVAKWLQGRAKAGSASGL